MKNRDENSLTRREFIATSGVAVAGLTLSEPANTTGAKPVRIGKGRWTYELVPDWGKLPEGIIYGMGCAVIVDSKDRVYVHTRSKDAVIVFDRNGKILNDYGAEFAQTGHGLYWHKEGKDEYLYFTDHPRNIVVKTDLAGKVLMRIGDVKEENSENIRFAFNQPTDVAVAPNGDIYVCEGYGGMKVHRFTARGKYLQSFGERAGNLPNQLNVPHGIWVDTRKGDIEIYVADRVNARLVVLTPTLELRRHLYGDVRNPCCFYEFKGKMYIPDLDHRVTILDERDNAVAQLGDGRGGVNDSTFEAPHAMAVDSHGDLYVIEWRQDARLRKFRHVPS